MAGVQASQLEKRYGRVLTFMLTGTLEHLIEKLGGVFVSFTLRGAEGDWLLIIRADFDGRAMVGFCGGVTAAGAVVRLEEKLRANELKWRADRFKNGQGKV